MSDISLQQLLEAGCHFGHKAERWHPKAHAYIYMEKDGIHIIDLAKTKDGLEKAVAFVKETVANGNEILFVGTKRQAKDIVKEEASRVHAAFITERWIGGFLTNWEGIQKMIKKIIRMTEEEATGVWKKFPKHEQMKLSHHLAKLNVFYGGVVALQRPPAVLFIVDIKKESVALKEAIRCNIPVIAIVDTNVNPTGIAYQIPANDDAVGSITIITKTIADAYMEAKEAMKKGDETPKKAKEAIVEAKEESVKEEENPKEMQEEKQNDAKKTVKTEEKPKKVRAKKVAP